MLVRDIVYQHHSPNEFHSHPPVYEIEKCLEIKSEMKNLAMKTKDNPRDILRNTKTRLNIDSVAFMGNDRNLKAMINRVRSNNNDYGKAQCLAFVPVDDVIKAFTCIKELADNQLDDFMNYFENTYIGKKKNAESTKRQVPMFPIRLWNVYDRVLNDEPRTNNGIEAWHSAFNVKLFSYI
jgi:hypothetical protein